MTLSTWDDRRNLLVQFQKELLWKFPIEDYNVFIFGSFIRGDFKAGTSDIDMIIYCDDSLKRMDITDFCEKFFAKMDIPTDAIEYYYMPEAYVYAVGILNSIPMTEYYPKILKDQLYVISKKYNLYLKEQSIRQRHRRWAYDIIKERTGVVHGRDTEGSRGVRIRR